MKNNNLDDNSQRATVLSCVESVAGYPVWSLGQNALLRSIQDDIKCARQARIIAINPEKVLRAEKDPQLQELLRGAEYLIPDGIGIIKASKKYGGSIRERITGIDFMDALCALAAANGYRVFLLGAREASVQGAKDALLVKYPELVICGVQNGYWTDDQQLIEQIRTAEPDIVFVALGSPRQEFWIRDHLTQVPARIFQGVGGSFDVFSGNVKRAPRWMCRLGLEWLYRLIRQPSRITRQVKLLSFFKLVKKLHQEERQC